MTQATILVTGGAGFIGSNFVLDWLQHEPDRVINLDRLTYAGNLQNLAEVLDHRGHTLVTGNISDSALVKDLFQRHRPRAVVHFAAESHVDRSIFGPEEFVQTNIVGTFRLLQEAREYWAQLPASERMRFRFLHVSTDEVYGSLAPDDPQFTETTAYSPNSPYSASKAASDHLVHAYHHTYGMPTLITNCSNNYGPRQFPEKLIPLLIVNALKRKPLPIYEDGLNVRDWLYVQDHCEAIRMVLKNGRPGETYNVGGESEKTNLDVVKTLCAILGELRPEPGWSYESLISFVRDRPGHDRRYAINIAKIQGELGWKPRETFESGMRRTVSWYLDNMDWVENVTSGAYQNWINKNYVTRGEP